MNKATLSFHQSLRMLDINGMEKLLKKNKDKIDLKGFPYLATDPGVANIDVTNFLIKNGADVNAQTEYGTTPLMLATRNNDINIVNLLLENGAKKTINAKELQSGYTALDWAIQYYARLKSEENYALVETLIKNGADIRIGVTYDISGFISDGDVAMTRLLLNNGADLKIHESGYWFSLTRGLYTNIEMIKLLFEYGVKPGYDFESSNFIYSLCRSQDSRDYEVLELFINNRLDINSYTDENNSLLSAALSTRNFDKAKILINNNAIVNCVVHGTTPLILAVKNGAPIDIVKMILDNGADPNMVEVVSKKSAFDYAKVSGNNSLINLIQERM